MPMKGFRIERKGRTADRWSDEVPKLRMEPTEWFGPQSLADVDITFTLKSKGGGETLVWLKVEEEGFATLAKTMMLANPQAAIKAFADAMRLGVERTNLDGTISRR